MFINKKFLLNHYGINKKINLFLTFLIKKHDEIIL